MSYQTRTILLAKRRKKGGGLEKGFPFVILLIGGIRLWATPLPSNCGLNSLFQLCELLGQPVEDSQILALARKYPTPDVSMADIKKEAGRLGLSLLGVKASLEELLTLNRPCIVHLRHPGHFVVLLDASPQTVRVPDNGKVQVWERKRFLERFSAIMCLYLEKVEREGETLHMVYVVDDQRRYIALSVGISEWYTLQAALRGDDVETISMDGVFLDLTRLCQVSLKEVRLTDIEEETGVIKSELGVEVRGREVYLKGRPSDLLRLGVHLELPMRVSSLLMEKAGCRKKDGSWASPPTEWFEKEEESS
jgi:bifunctional DNase/RNase